MADSLLSNVSADLPLKAFDFGLILYIGAIIVVAYILTYLLSLLLVWISERVGWYRVLLSPW